MTTDIPQLKLFKSGRLLLATPIDRPLVLGRQRSSEDSPPLRLPLKDCDRIVVAREQDTNVSREHARIEWLGSQVRIKNVSTVRSLEVEPGGELRCGESILADAGVRLRLSSVTVRIDAPQEEIEPIGAPTLPPKIGPTDLEAEGLMDTLGTSFDSAQGNVLLAWLRSTAAVFNDAASSPTFLPQAAKAVTKIVGLDQAIVLRYHHEDGWEIAACEGEVSVSEPDQLSQQLLAMVLEEKRTFVMHPRTEGMKGSLEQLDAVVVAPILDELGEVAGAIYSTRHFSEGESRSKIRRLEGSLVELIAAGVAAGWARLRYEQQAMSARIRFEQFFGPDLAARLENDPSLMEGRDSVVTAVFCDIVGFSAVSERLPSRLVVQWINDTLGALSECVIQNRGVLVDYVGDELFGMWGAPFEVEDHARLACKAALEMRRKVEEVSRRWESRLGEPFDVRIGINTGPACVGNIGSEWKFKYGPLGSAINIASRVQGAAKFAGAHLLMTGETLRAMRDRAGEPSAASKDVGKSSERLHMRRIGKVAVVNVVEPVELYELRGADAVDWQAATPGFEEALRLLECGQLSEAAKTVEGLTQSFPEDEALRVLAGRIRAADPGEDYSVWHLGRK